MAVSRAYSVLDIKSFDTDQRLIAGVATSPRTDRVGDIVDARGALFNNPLPLLLHHDSRLPIGTVKLFPPDDNGIRFEAQLAHVEEPGTLRDRVAEAWQSIKAGLLRGASIGFRPLKDGIEVLKDGGLRFKSIEILEMSVVTVAANQDCTIDYIRSLDTALPVPGRSAVVHLTSSPGATGSRNTGSGMKTYGEQITQFENTRAAKVAERDAIQQKAMGEGRSKDESEKQAFDVLSQELESIDRELIDLRKLEAENIALAIAPSGNDPAAAAASRGGNGHGSYQVTVRDTLPPGIGFARAVLCQAAAFSAFQKGNFTSAEQFAKQHYPDDSRVKSYLQFKAAVPAGTSTQTVWAAPLVDPTNLAGEFIEYLRPQTIIGRIPGLRRIPFNVRIIAQTGGGNGYWVGEGAPKPLTSFAFTAVTHAYHKLACIAVITEELARFSSPSAEQLVRDSLAAAIIERMDRDFIDPAEAGTAGVQPASITNGVTALSSAGTSADNARTDVQNLIEGYLVNNQSVAGLVLIMPNTLALALSVMVNSLGQPEFPGINMTTGGLLMGIPVVTSQYAANESGGGNLLIAVNAPEIFLSDDGQVTVDASREASLQMLDNPTNNSATATATTMVSMWQTNSIALRAERFITWTKRRATAVVYMDDVNWGAIGSPS